MFVTEDKTARPPRGSAGQLLHKGHRSRRQPVMRGRKRWGREPTNGVRPPHQVHREVVDSDRRGREGEWHGHTGDSGRSVIQRPRRCRGPGGKGIHTHRVGLGERRGQLPARHLLVNMQLWAGRLRNSSRSRSNALVADRRGAPCRTNLPRGGQDHAFRPGTGVPPQAIIKAPLAARTGWPIESLPTLPPRHRQPPAVEVGPIERRVERRFLLAKGAGRNRAVGGNA